MKVMTTHTLALMLAFPVVAAERGSMAVAGPVDTIEKAETLIATDPAVTIGQLRFELYVWYGPVAITNVVSQSRLAATQ